MPAARRRPAWTVRPPTSASIPPRPERPSPEFRQAVTDALAKDRANSRDPLVLRSIPAPRGPAGRSQGGATAGDALMPAAPPRRAALAAAPAIPWAEAPAAAPEFARRDVRWDDAASRGGPRPAGDAGAGARRAAARAARPAAAAPLSRFFAPRPPRRPHGGADLCRDRLYTGGPRRLKAWAHRTDPSR